MTAKRQHGNGDTATRILDVAERLVQERGFNGFSYADVATELGLTKAALHYHFAGKSELGEALISRYAHRFAEALASLDNGANDAPAKLNGYVGLYLEVVRDQRMCLCGMLAAEYRTLPTAMREPVVQFFDDNETWLRRVLEQGRDEATVRFEGRPNDEARMIIACLEGAMLVSRPSGDLDRFQAAASRLVADLVAGEQRADSDRSPG
jgi:TetR/AcrR family transcriptional repressor of nem operon